MGNPTVDGGSGWGVGVRGWAMGCQLQSLSKKPVAGNQSRTTSASYNDLLLFLSWEGVGEHQMRGISLW